MKTLWVGTRKGLFRCEPRGNSWVVASVHFLGDPVPIVMRDPRDGAIYAALDHGHFGNKLHRSDDDGRCWKEIAVPTYPAKPDDAAPTTPDGKEAPWALKLIWELACGGRDQAGTLWCGTIPGGLFRSQDRGDSWELNRPLWDEPARNNWFGGGADWPGLHSICVDPQDSDHVLVGVSCGGVWRTRDGGDSWSVCAEGMRAEFMPPERAGDQTIQDPHRVVQCAEQPSHLWVQHHCGIYKSTDYAKSWQEVKAPVSSFGFGVVTHPRDPRIAYFVPAVSDERRVPVDGRVVVTRTRDGGESFDVLSNGLPGQHAYDLVFRHALDIDTDGLGLAFGSTTGSLWTSIDAGDSWQTLSQNLPPVYCVRFAS